MTADPLTPAEAVAIAAVLEAHPERMPHWLRWVKKLRAIANESTPVEPESERPTATLEARNEAVPQGAETPGGTSPLHLDRSNREDKQL